MRQPGRGRPTRAPSVLTGWTGVVVAALDAHGLDGRAMAASAGITEAALDQPTGRVPTAAASALWRAAVAATGDEAFGLVAARQVRPATFGALGFAVLASSTLREAFERTARYCTVVHDEATLAAVAERDRFVVTLSYATPADASGPEAVDAILAAIIGVARVLGGTRIAPAAVSLRRSPPDDARRHQRVFGDGIAFAAPANRVEFARTDVEARVPAGNAELARSSDAVVSAYLAGLSSHRPGVVEEVRAALVDLLPGGEPTAATVATALATSARTLQRRLGAEGTSYRAVVAELRRDLAIEHLRAGERSVTEITYLLGFSEVASFSRAFKRWTGTPPSRFR